MRREGLQEPKAKGGPPMDRRSNQAAGASHPLEHAVPELAVMANVLNPETESITLNTTLEPTTLEPATELEQLASIDQPSPESTSNPETSSVAEAHSLDADAITQPSIEAVEPEPAPPEVPAASAPEAVTSAEIEVAPAAAAENTAPAPVVETLAPAAETPAPVVESPVLVAPIPAVAVRSGASAAEPGDDFSSALAEFEREQAAEAAAVEAHGDKIVTGKVEKQTDKYLVVDVGLKSEGLVPLEQVTDHTGAVIFKPGDEIDVVIEREEAEGGYLVSYERAQRLRVWDTIEKAANDKTPVKGTVVSRVKGGLTVDIGIKAFLPGSQLEIRPVRNLDGYLGQQIDVRVIKPE